MISLRIGDCEITIIPIIKGLVSESDKINEFFSTDYEAAAIALGLEEVEALRRRSEIKGEYETSDLDSVYSFLLKNFGPINLPDPAFTTFVDLCEENNLPLIPLDMNDEVFTKEYCEKVKPLEIFKEKKIMKKAMKMKIDKTSPEKFVEQWDSLVNTIKGYRKMSAVRERYIAEQLIDIANYRKTLIAVIEHERINGIMSIIENR